MFTTRGSNKQPSVESPHLLIRYHRLIVGVIFALIVLVPVVALAYDWPQFNGNASHTGNNTQETLINLNNVSSLKKLFQVPLMPDADGAPVYLSGVNTAGGTRDLLFVTQSDGSITALDAHSGVTVWHKLSYNGSCTSTDPSEQPCYTTSSPAIDPNHQYVYSYAHDGKVHKYNIGNGNEVIDSHWPEVISLKPGQEKESSPLTIATVGNTFYLYVPSAGYNGDRGDYQGHLTTINLNDGSQKVFNTLCSNQPVHFAFNASPDCAQVQSAVWTRSGVTYDPDNGKIYIVTGNGTYDPTKHDWGDSILALNADGSGNINGDPVDAFTPSDYQNLDNADLDLGSAPLVVLPTAGYTGIKYTHLGAHVGKDAKGLRLFNLDNLSGRGGPGHLDGEIVTTTLHYSTATLTAPAVWQDANNKTWLFIANFGGVEAFQLTIDGVGNPSLVSKWNVSGDASSPLVANGVLYYADGYGGNKIHALDPTTGVEKWSDSSLGPTHWESPVVANGIVYITDGPKYGTSNTVLPNGHLTAYALPSIAALTADSGSNQSASVNTAFSLPLVARVSDSLSKGPIAGAVVTFTSPISGASGSFAGGSTVYTGTTNASGLVTTTRFTANATIGTYTITATVAQAAGSNLTSAATFNLTNVAQCNSVVVTSSNDDGSCGTLRSAVVVANNGATKAVSINLAANSTINLTTGLTLGSGVSITTTAQCGSQSGPNNTLTMLPPIIIQGGGSNSGNGLTLTGNNRLYGLWVRGFSGLQIHAPAGSSTKMQCIKASKL